MSLAMLLVLGISPFTVAFRPVVNIDDLGYGSEQTYLAKETHLAAFGSPDSNMFYLEGMDFLSEEGLALLVELERKLPQRIPYLKRSYSLLSLLPPSTAYPSGDRTRDEETRAWLIQRVRNSPSVSGHLVSRDGRQALIVMDFNRFPADAPESPYLAVGRAMDELIQEFSLAHSQDTQDTQDTQGAEIWGSGAAQLVYQQYIFYLQDLSKIFLALVIVMLFLILLMMRSWLAFWGTILSCFIANWLTIGFMALLNYDIDLTFLMIPVTIGVATAIGYSVHLYNHFKHSVQHTSIDIALAITWARCVRPLTFTALTTMLSFLSLHLVPIRAIRITGYACLLVVFLVYIFTLTIFPLILSFTQYKPKFSKMIRHSKWELSYLIELITNISFRYQNVIIIISLLLLIISSFYLKDLRANYNFKDFMGPENKAVRDLDYLASSGFAPIGTVSVVIQNPNGFLQSLDELQKLQDIVENIQAESIVSQVFWVGDIIDDAAVLRGQSNGLASLRSLSELNGLLLLSGRISGFDADAWLSQDRKNMRIMLEVTSFESASSIDLSEKYQAIIEDAIPDSHVFFTGFIMDTSRGDLVITNSFIQSIIVSIGIVFLLLFIIFRRAYLTLVSLIPNIFPIILVGGLISFLKIDLNSFILMVFPMVIGLIVDDTIHFFYHVVSRFDSSNNYRASIHFTLSRVGPALVETTIILCSTFSVFLFSNFQGLARMGLLAVIVILLALLADLILGPIFLSKVPAEYLHRPQRRHRRSIFQKPKAS